MKFEMYNHNLSCIHLLMMKMMRRLSCKHPIFILSCSRSRNRLLFSTSTSTSTSRVEENGNMVAVDYLIKSCGLSVEEAKKASKSFNWTKVPPNPDSVLKFLKENGFNQTHMRTLICKRPRLLCTKVDKTLKPKFTFFQELGFSDAAFADLAAKNPYLLLHSTDTHLTPRVNYLRTMIHSAESLVKTIQRYSWILTCSYDKNILPTIQILRECGFNQSQIQLFVLRQPMAITMPGYVRKAIDRAREFGFPCPSPMFTHALRIMVNLSVATFDKKVKMLRSFGWMEEEISSAFRKEPNFFTRSESKVRQVSAYLSNEVGCSTREIAHRPTLFGYSLEKRLVPRNEVLKVLKSRGWVKPKLQLVSLVYISDQDFLNKYVLPFSDRDPHLLEMFMARIRR